MSKAILFNQLRTHRKRAYLFQKEVALLLAARSRTTVSYHEAGDRRPTLEDAFAYEALFGIPARKLFPGVYEAVSADIQARATELLKNLCSTGGNTPAVRQKRAFLESALTRLRS